MIKQQHLIQIQNLNLHDQTQEQDNTQKICLSVKYKVSYDTKKKVGRFTLNKKTDIVDIKRKLLLKLGFIKENHDKVNLQIITHLGVANIPYPVQVDTLDNFTYLIERELQYEDDIQLKLVNINLETELVKKNPRFAVIQFDSQGSIDSIDGQLDIITPSQPPCPIIKNLKCAFCHQPQSNRNVLKHCGRMYGPYGGSYFHLLCAIWCPNIFLTAEGDLIGVEKQVQRSKNICCKVCGYRGAGLGCILEGCKTAVHYLCAVSMRYQMDWTKYTFFCGQKCKNQAKWSSMQSGDWVQQNNRNVSCLQDGENSDEDFTLKGNHKKLMKKKDKDRVRVQKVIRNVPESKKQLKSMLFQ